MQQFGGGSRLPRIRLKIGQHHDTLRWQIGSLLACLFRQFEPRANAAFNIDQLHAVENPPGVLLVAIGVERERVLRTGERNYRDAAFGWQRVNKLGPLPLGSIE